MVFLGGLYMRGSGLYMCEEGWVLQIAEKKKNE